MLKGNLSTRPFYNERLVSLALILVAVGAAALTAFNATRLLSLSAQRTALKQRIERDQNDAARVRAGTLAVSKTVNGPMLTGLAASTREANEIIDRRTFSWTVFFDLIERVMPFDVRLEAVTPRVEKGVFKVAMIIVARRASDVDDFIDALLGTQAFRDVLPNDQSAREDGSFTAVIEAEYSAPRPPEPEGVKGTPAPAQAPAPSATPAATTPAAATPAKGRGTR